MECPHCQRDIPIKREFCPHCGQRVTLAFDQIAGSVRQDAASRRGRELERGLRWLIVVLLVVAAVLVGLNDLWDARLLYDGSDLPMMEAPPVSLVQNDSILRPYRERRPLKPLPGQPPQAFGYRRSKAIRGALRDANGGREELSQAIQHGFRFLARRQQKDGSWAVTTQQSRIRKERNEAPRFRWARTGLTALALLALLGEGETWPPAATSRRRTYARAVQRGLRFLIKGQDEVNGRFGPSAGNFMYNHGLATLAVAEAAGMSGDPFLREAAQKGVDLIERTQGKEGGWGYHDQIGEREDTSVSAWQVQALLAAREAGLKVNAQVLRKALQYYRSATDPRTGRVAYELRKDDQVVRPGLYGVALMLRQLLGEPPRTAAVRLLANKTMEALPRSRKGWGKGWRAGSRASVNDDERAREFDPYRWYFATYGLFFFGGENWGPWNGALTKALLALQDSDGAWRANDIWSVKAGASYSTAMCLLCLEVYYRIQ